jgi:hypothetical protein
MALADVRAGLVAEVRAGTVDVRAYIAAKIS